jgi:hypothetical protein
VHALLRGTVGKTGASERHPYPWEKANPIRVGRSLRDLRVLAHPRPEIEGHRVEPLHRIAEAPVQNKRRVVFFSVWYNIEVVEVLYGKGMFINLP